MAAFTQPNALLAPLGADATSALQLQDNNQNNIMVPHVVFNRFSCTAEAASGRAANMQQIEKNLVHLLNCSMLCSALEQAVDRGNFFYCVKSFFSEST